MSTITLRTFIDNNLNKTELEQLANPPLTLSLPIEELLKVPPVKRTNKHKPLNRFLIYRRNYAASFPANKKPSFKKITKGASAKWMLEGKDVRTFFLLLAQIMSRYMAALSTAEQSEIKPTFPVANTPPSPSSVVDSQEALAYSNNESLPPKTIYICHCPCPFNTEVPDTMYNAIIDPYANAETTESQLYYNIGPYYYAGEFTECQSFYNIGSYAGSEITGDQYFYSYAGADNQFIYNTGPYAGSEFTADNNVNPRWQ